MPLEPGAGHNVILRDFIDARQAKVYRVGCEVPAADPDDLLEDGGFERFADMDSPLVMNADLVESPAAARAVGFPTDAAAATFPLLRTAAAPRRRVFPRYDGASTDDRASVTASTAAPRSGRYAARVLVANRTLVVKVPLAKNVALNRTSYVFSYAFRSSPAGLFVAPELANGTVASTTCPAAAAAAWTYCAATLSLAPPATVALRVDSPLEGGGGIVWLDDLRLVGG